MLIKAFQPSKGKSITVTNTYKFQIKHCNLLINFGNRFIFSFQHKLGHTQNFDF